MPLTLLRAVSLAAVFFGFVPARALAQVLPQTLPRSVQPGLEAAVKWKWWVQPTDEKDWGVAANEPAEEAPPVPPGTPDATAPGAEKKDAPHGKEPLIAPGNYEVKRGDALASIARKAGISVAHLKTFNGLTKDLIRAGQTLKIPTPAEVAALNPPPPPPPPRAPVAVVDPITSIVPHDQAPPKKGRKGRKGQPKELKEPEVNVEGATILFQIFLDRENFSNGPIDGKQGVALDRLLGYYQSLHRELQTYEALRKQATATVGEPFTHYRLKRADFRFIDPPKPESPPPPAPPKIAEAPKGKGKKPVAPPKPPPPPAITYEDLVARKFSGYRSAWEFVAERFHCDETYLRLRNDKIKGTPTVDTEFEVPNVTPFEIENCFAGPLRPAAEEDKPVTATIAEFSRLEIRKGGQVVAMLPVSRARPDLRGRGSWTILDAVVAPRLATRQEPKSPPKPVDPAATAAPLLDGAHPLTHEAAPPVAAPLLTSDQILAAGPRNPVGIYWINLAKANSTTALPYGLHGTAIPGHMNTQESLGGLRMTNWDIARAIRMLPEGTPLIWH